MKKEQAVVDLPRFRLVVLGAAKCGKTSIIRRFLYNEYKDAYRETVEDLHSKEFVVKGIRVAIDILDTNINFPDMRKVAIASANAFLIVFGVDDVQSFKEMSDLWNEVASRRTDFREIPSVIAGNKNDILTKKIYEATANAWSSRLNANVRYVECSAKTSQNVPKIFDTLIELSGFPVGYDVPLPSPKAPPSRSGSQKDKLKKIKEANAANEEKLPQNVENQLCEQISSGLSLPFDRLNMLRRNQSVKVFQIPRKNNQVERPSTNDDNILRSKGSIIRRTKHLSLKLHKNSDNRIVADEGVENQQQQGDCVVS
ncbi:hypothetical protein M3Y97_00897700 [Aphelenchoides bicaudatus]|nr:hypothetical protein M3Y97_00897700 [Aphelenchoides bicaudatus]